MSNFPQIRQEKENSFGCVPIKFNFINPIIYRNFTEQIPFSFEARQYAIYISLSSHTTNLHSLCPKLFC